MSKYKHPKLNSNTWELYNDDNASLPGFEKIRRHIGNPEVDPAARVKIKNRESFHRSRG